MTDKTDLIKNLKTMISLRSDGNHADLSDEYEGAYIEGQAEYITDLFIEQACEAASNFLMTKTRLDVYKIADLEQAIRDRFKPSESS